MTQIRPVSDLRNNFAEISRSVHETNEPVVLTKNGRGDMVVISYENYEAIQHEVFVMSELKKADNESREEQTRFTHNEVIADIRRKLQKTGDNSDV